MSGPASNTIDCNNCRASCCRLQVLLFGDNDVPESMVEWSDWGGQVMRRETDGWCTALDRHSMRCTIYAQRPQLCRDYAMGGSECQDEWQPNADARSVPR
ncbi:MAG: YkgJ family cysteine cluster protein [Gammaproteobacteria bacterium]|nr:YkgJ family cysteine cluster protein [Gammaproteobacteria bacterium]MCW8972030.1 YkgJ family cysteine cluster protein [Gammaproteobacteria bacterium]MCW8993204.1 YkgJ family cysteine cluster protein [Gammaproteobacteria bacterium]